MNIRARDVHKKSCSIVESSGCDMLDINGQGTEQINVEFAVLLVVPGLEI
jgi:hypothetical protein